MNRFRGFVKKEFLHVVRDRRTLLILFGIPVVQLVLFGFAIRNEVDDIAVGIVDLSNDFATHEIANRLSSSGHFNLVEFASTDVGLEEAFRRGRIKEAVIFEPRFAERLFADGTAHVQVIADATNPNVASTVLAYTTAVIARYQRELGAGMEETPVIASEVRMRFNPELKSVYLFVPGLIALVLMLVCALMTSITITREKELGTMEVLLVSPLRPRQIIVGKVLPYLGLSMAIVVVILGLANMVFGVPIRGSVLLLLAECALFTACALGLGILISTKANTQQTATMVSLAGLLLPTVILSGFIFPIASMPTPMQWVSHIVPAKWFLIIIRSIMVKGAGFEFIWKETAILTGMTMFLLAASVRNFKDRLEG
jgi:ABC-2 type transport system permease protein